jgi:putative NADH-flavin reductase
MKVTVFGASGKVGRLVVNDLIEGGDTVFAFTHSHAPFEASDRLVIIKGDIHNLDDVKRAMNDSSLAISTLGSWGSKDKDIVGSGTQNIVSAMKAQGIKRIVTLTGTDAHTNKDQISLLQKLTHALILKSPAKKILIDGEKHISILENSDLDWTILRSPVMRSSGSAANFK